MPYLWQALTIFAMTIWLIAVTIGIPVLTYRRYLRKRHLRHARLAFLLLGAGAEVGCMESIIVPLHTIVGWSVLSGYFELPFGLTFPVALAVLVGLTCVAMALLGMSFQYMPDDASVRTGGTSQDTHH